MLELGHSPSCIPLEEQCPFLEVSTAVSMQCQGAVWVLGVGLTFHPSITWEILQPLLC